MVDVGVIKKRNLKITFEWADGTKREYNTTAGELFTIKSCHPKYGETFILHEWDIDSFEDLITIEK